MVEFPQVARRHLSRIASRGDHPDSGILTAFVEGTLAKNHRQDLFNHLAGCSECNRVLAMIAPELEVSPAVQPVAARSRWFAWGSLQWAAGAAAAAMVVSAVWIGRVDQDTVRPTSPPAIVQQVSPAPVIAQTTPPAVVASPGASRPERPNRPAPESRELAKAAPVTTQPPGPAQFDPALAAQSRPGVPGGLRGESAFQTSVISSAPPTATPDVAPAIKANTPAVPATPAGPMWAISDVGALQHSTDGGHQWAVLAVPNRAPLRVVWALDQKIWVGGDAGGLYHSADAGRTWTAVVPTWNGQTLTADITRIAFTDLRRGWVVTRDGQIWATADAGATWSLKTGPK